MSRYLECGPAGVLSAMGAGCVQNEAVFTASQRTPRGADEPVDEVRSLLRALGELHVSGQDIAWDKALPDGTPVDLPTYAFRRKHHWIEPKAGRNTGRNTGRGRPHADDALWQAVGSGESERVSELLGVTDSSAVATLLPYLATWREQQDRAGEVADWSYEETWQPSPVARTAPLPRGHWLIVAPAAAQALAGELAGALTGGGASPHLLTADTGTDTDTTPGTDTDTTPGTGADTDSGAGADRAAYAASIGDLLAELGDEPLRGVLALTAADTAPHPGHPAVTTGAARSLALVQALGDASVRAPLWFVTQGAVRAHDTDPAPSPAQALAWGLGHVVALEHANRWGGLVDLPAEPDPTTTRRLLATLAAHGTPGAEEHVALRPAERLVRRLRRTGTATATARPWTPRGTVLITGGSGALAAHLAHRLAERGAEHLVLVSRRGPDAEGAAELTAALEAAGARVTLASCDVTDRRRLDELLTELDHDAAPLRAVFHTAGVLDDRLIDRLDAEALAAVAAPKLTAATHLHELTRDRDLDAFVLYSSVVGTLGNIGQANYAMANAAMDALAAGRRAEGLPAVSIGWGPWADGGMTHGAAESQLRRIGLEPMPAERALDALDTALDHGGSTVVAGIDWPRAAAAYTEGGDRPFLHEVPEARAAVADAPAEQANPLRTTLLALAEDARENHLRSLLAVEAAAVLGAENPASLDPERGFKDLGFDSMMAVDLSVRVQKRTGVITPKTLIFDHPNLAAAARWLLGELAPALTETSAAVAAHRTDEPLAVVGVGLRMPGDAHDLDSLWDVLAEGRDTVRQVPADRFDIDTFYDPDPDAEGRTYARHASFLDDVAHFDAAFFGISPREAEPMDPQHRLLLEAAWNSLENAGIRPRELRDSRTGVFVGAGVGEYGKYRPNGAPDTYTLTGTLPSFNAGRLSYHLGLQGPALSIDTACSSSLVALHLACEALRNDECELALAGGVQVLTDPGAFIALSRSHALSPDGRSKAFSAEADGYGRGEGVGVIAVMRLSDAIKQNRTVLGVIRATAINHDGASSGITAPNGSSQQKVIRAALRSAGLSTEDVDYVECHGTGTSLGDPIEVQALAAVYGEGREPGRELGLGTAKSVIGHLESAAGIAGVCKMLASFRKDALPGTRYSSPRNPNIAWDDLPVRVVDELTPWEREEGRVRRAGVSSFGLSGTNAHVIVEEPPAAEATEAADISGGPVPVPVPVPVVVSGRDEAALREQAGRWASWLSGPEREGVRVADVAVTAARHRSHFESRASVVASDAAGLVEVLEALAEGRSHDAVVTGSAERRGKVVFVYPGQGSQWVGMGRELLDSSEVFAETVDACDTALLPFTGWSVREVLAGEEGDHPSFGRVDVVQPALFAMGVALSALWRSLGVEPAAVVGHSQGEVVAAVVSGALTLEQGAQIVAQRSKAVLACAGQGGMALIERPLAVVEEFLTPYGDALSVAAVNTAGSTVISGQADAIEQIVTELQEKEVYARKINVDYASHNAQMDPLLPALADGFEGLAPRRADLAFYSTVTGEVSDGTNLDGGYWCRNLREPVRFDRALNHLLDDGHTVFVEISAHPVLSMPLTDGSADRGGIVVGSLARRNGGAAQLLRNLGLLHVQGHEVDWGRALGLAPATGTGSLLNLPTYAFQREHYWLPVPKATGDAGSLGLETSPHPWLGAVTELADGEGHLFTGRLSLTDQPWLKDHTVFGTVIVPGTGLLELATAAAHEAGADGVAELALAEPLVIDEAVRIQITVGAPGANGRRPLAIHSRPDDTQDDWTRHASGELREEPADRAPDDFAELRRWPVAGAERVDLDGFYDRFGAQGIDYGPAFRGLTELWRKGDTAYGIVRLPETAGSTGSAAEYNLHPALLDTALHIMKGVIPAQGAEEPEGALLPFEWSDVELYAAGSAELRVRIDVEASEAGQEIRVRAADATGEPVVRIGGLHLRRATAEQLRAARNTGADGLHRLEFQPVTAPAPQGAVADAVLTGTGELAALIGVRTLSDIDELTALLDSGPQAPARVVVDTTGRPPFYSEPEAAYKATEYVLAQLQELLSDDRLDPTELVWVTRGSVAAAPGDRLDGLPYAPLWGLIRSARAEHPERGLRLIDLGPDDADRNALARALAVTGEPELAVRGGEVLAARLVREATTDEGTATDDRAATDDGTAARPLDPEGTVLITGGTGELGRETARHLVRHHGVRHLVLTSRRGAEAPGAAELIHELEEEGARCVRVVACDVARRDDVAQVLGLAEEGRPWTAVLHLAGILDDGVLLGQDAERLSRVMAPKVKGALYLDELTRDLDLAAFVLFSSAAGTVGTAGQSIYGAANTYLDAFAARRRAEGRPATALAWGLWHQAGVGMTSHLGAVELERMRRQGIAPLPFEQGLALLDAVLARPAGNFVPVKLDLRAVRRAAEQGQDVPALFRALVRRRLRRAPSADTATSPAGLRERLLAAPEDRRGDLVTEMVLREVATVLGVSGGGSLSPQQVLKDLGLDSLMAVELRRRLSAESGISLPATLAFDYPTPDHIARLVLGRMDLPTETPATGAPGDGVSGAEDPESVLGRVLEQLSADRIHRSGLLEQLVELARQEGTGTGAVAALPIAPAEEERSVDDINAELNALLEASGLDLD
ncbi:SDR family NAD(P)-dependent oxidoreductase, partial [Streptomyces sp. NPDC057496]|uniref:SDR family NAD(P)-dependent oxidoreductase n=1 Tax=Streptomyces sp. NPDC057496 TaxID=3346149 RepID=UPI0036ADAC95